MQKYKLELTCSERAFERIARYAQTIIRAERRVAGHLEITFEGAVPPAQENVPTEVQTAEATNESEVAEAVPDEVQKK
jgi:hypothetical protein